jgi:hypothetical protein
MSLITDTTTQCFYKKCKRLMILTVYRKFKKGVERVSRKVGQRQQKCYRFDIRHIRIQYTMCLFRKYEHYQHE